MQLFLRGKFLWVRFLGENKIAFTDSQLFSSYFLNRFYNFCIPASNKYTKVFISLQNPPGKQFLIIQFPQIAERHYFNVVFLLCYHCENFFLHLSTNLISFSLKHLLLPFFFFCSLNYIHCVEFCFYDYNIYSQVVVSISLLIKRRIWHFSLGHTNLKPGV